MSVIIQKPVTKSHICAFIATIHGSHITFNVKSSQISQNLGHLRLVSIGKIANNFVLIFLWNSILGENYCRYRFSQNIV